MKTIFLVIFQRAGCCDYAPASGIDAAHQIAAAATNSVLYELGLKQNATTENWRRKVAKINRVLDATDAYAICFREIALFKDGADVPASSVPFSEWIAEPAEIVWPVEPPPSHKIDEYRNITDEPHPTVKSIVDLPSIKPLPPKAKRYFADVPVTIITAHTTSAQAIIDEVESEIEQRQFSGNVEDWKELQDKLDALKASLEAIASYV